MPWLPTDTNPPISFAISRCSCVTGYHLPTPQPALEAVRMWAPMHIWWTCPIVSSYWDQIFSMLTALMGIHIAPNPAIALLNKRSNNLTTAQFKLLLHVTAASKQIIAKAWKKPTICTLETKHRIIQFMVQSKIKATLLDRISKHLNICQPWTDHYLHLFTLIYTLINYVWNLHFLHCGINGPIFGY